MNHKDNKEKLEKGLKYPSDKRKVCDKAKVLKEILISNNQTVTCRKVEN